MIPCSCPTAVAQSVSAMSNTLMDVCSDCGHTSNCCFSHTAVPFAGSITLSQQNVQLELPAIAVFDFGNNTVCAIELSVSGINKAPPRSQHQTLVSLNQRLLI